MSSLIQDVKKDFPEFWDLKISISGSTYLKTEFDSIHAKLLFERLTETSNTDDLVLVAPDDPTLTILILIEALVSLLKYDILEGSAHHLNDLEIGAPVVYVKDDRSTELGTYFGMTEYNGVLYHRVKHSLVRKGEMPCTHYVPVHYCWKIQPYVSKATVTRKHRPKVFGEALEKLIGLPPGGLLRFQRTKALIVTPDKSILREQIKSVSLGDDPFEAIFPITEYSDVESCRNIGKNSLGRVPVLGLVSNTDIAVDIALRDPAIRLFIIDGKSKIRSHYGSIEMLNADTKPRKTVCLLKSTDEEEIDTLARIGLDVWLWRRRDFSAQAEPLSSPDDKFHNDSISLHNKVLNCLSGPAPRSIIVETETELDTAINNAYTCLKDIGEGSEIAAFLFFKLLQLPISVNDYNDYLESSSGSVSMRLDNQLEDLQKEIRNSFGFSIQSKQKDGWEMLIEHLSTIYHLLKNINPKAETIKNLLADYQHETVSLICGQSDYARALISARLKHSGLKIIQTNSKAINPEENVIVAGWYSRHLAIRLFLAPYMKLTFVLYSQEAALYEWARRTCASSPTSSIDAKLRDFLGMHIEPAVEPHTGGSLPNADIGTVIESIVQGLSAHSYRGRFVCKPDEEKIEAQMIEFEDDSFIYVMENSRLYKLDNQGRNPRLCKVCDIDCGDELIVADSDRDLFEELLSIVQQSETYKHLFKEARLWHIVLKNYFETNNLSFNKLSEEFIQIGINPTITTIRSWVLGTTSIGPSEENLRAIAELTKDPVLNKQLESVIAACSKLHSVHIQTGRVLVQKIIHAATKEDMDGLDEETSARLDTYSQSARILIVRGVSENTESIPLRMVGELFEG